MLNLVLRRLPNVDVCTPRELVRLNLRMFHLSPPRSKVVVEQPELATKQTARSLSYVPTRASVSTADSSCPQCCRTFPIASACRDPPEDLSTTALHRRGAPVRSASKRSSRINSRTASADSTLPLVCGGKGSSPLSTHVQGRRVWLPSGSSITTPLPRESAQVSTRGCGVRYRGWCGQMIRTVRRCPAKLPLPAVSAMS